jgi:DNA-directed RNA polymerase subunit RPC12/RpoP
MNYITQPAEKSHCPQCGESVTMLCTKYERGSHIPWFYICWACKRIFHIGVGEVKEDLT